MFRPDPSDSIGVLGGKTMKQDGAEDEEIHLQWKQD
jgi:hypothetical protein